MSVKDNDTSIMRMNFRSHSEPWKAGEDLREKEPKPDIKNCRCCTCRDLGKVSG
jgi:hypothetical protein